MGKSIFLSRKPVLAVGELLGRSLEIEAICNHLDRPRPENVNLIGEPRSGKSSLLYTIYREQVGLPPEMAGLYVWVRLATLRARDPAAFWRFMLRQLDAAAAEMGWSPGAEMPPRQAAKADFYDALDLGLDTLLAETACARVIFVLDDFDLLRESLSGEDLDWLRALVNHYSDGLGLVLGSTDPLTQIEAAIQGESNVSPLSPLFQTVRLGLLDEAAAVQLCHRAAELEGFQLNMEDLAFLLREAGYHPDLLKVACGYLFAGRRREATNVVTLTPASPDKFYRDVRSDMRFDNSVSWLCETLYKRQPLPARRILRALAMGETVHESEALQSLLHRMGLLEVHHDHYALFADSFRYWISQQPIEIDETNQSSNKEHGKYSRKKPGSESSQKHENKSNRKELYDILIKHFDREELRTLCFDLGVEYDDLDAKGRKNKARELIRLLERHESIIKLEQRIIELRPNLSLSDLGDVSS